jgi:NAD(P)-dependent dehydrogenase (short-subunit alcohol dehydrogenase family)
MRAAIFGASGGIGRALSAALALRHPGADIFNGARAANTVADLPGTPFTFDLADEESIVQAVRRMGAGGPLDLAIVATGILQRGEQIKPERSFRQIDPEAMAEVFRINTIGPAIIAKHVLPLFPRGGRPVFVAISARVGSIGDNRLGGWHSYRASKAALNMLVRNLAIEMRTRNPESIVAALHPGTVDTPLSKPFQRNLRSGQLASPSVSAGHLLDVIDSLTPAESGHMLSWEGEILPP